MANVVLVVDMVRGFLEPGHNLYCGDDARRIIDPVRELLRREADAGSSLFSLFLTTTCPTTWSFRCSRCIASSAPRSRR